MRTPEVRRRLRTGRHCCCGRSRCQTRRGRQSPEQLLRPSRRPQHSRGAPAEVAIKVWCKSLQTNGGDVATRVCRARDWVEWVGRTSAKKGQGTRLVVGEVAATKSHLAEAGGIQRTAAACTAIGLSDVQALIYKREALTLARQYGSSNLSEFQGHSKVIMRVCRPQQLLHKCDSEGG